MPVKRERHNRDSVLRGALRLVDEQGIAALSMRRLARELEIEATTLYSHVQSKDEILEGLEDLVLREVERPSLAEEAIEAGPLEADDWEQALRGFAWATRRQFLAHPNVVPVIVASEHVTPARQRLLDGVAELLLDAGFDRGSAHKAWHLVQSYVFGHFYFIDHRRPRPARRWRGLEAIEAGAPGEQADARRHDTDAEFEFGLDALIAGLRAMRDPADR